MVFNVEEELEMKKAVVNMICWSFLFFLYALNTSDDSWFLHDGVAVGLAWFLLAEPSNKENQVAKALVQHRSKS